MKPNDCLVDVKKKGVVEMFEFAVYAFFMAIFFLIVVVAELIIEKYEQRCEEKRICEKIRNQMLDRNRNIKK